MLANTELIVAIALPVLLLLILSAILCFRYFQHHTVGDVESGSIEALARSSIEDAFSPIGSASRRTLGASVQTTPAAIGLPESIPPSHTSGVSAQTIFAAIGRPESTSPKQTLGASAQTTAFAALIPLDRFRVNPVLQFHLEGQEYEINMANKDEPINSRPKRMDSEKLNKPLMQGIGPVSRVFCHIEIGGSIIEKLRREVDVTILESEKKWATEMSEYL
ncbi:hypothetical protein FSARC_14258 [Fusarium sarcochroum]|uniref:Uncharacterized protein n=1 Tax=Fusarium sarcochroum TaxID=1208366 RepID=A0A8H4WPN2_9HYPO|nr:hypothetical protein FSARC_14258 [Fusarium sarcochroum]